MDIDVGVDEGDTDQIVVLQLPQIDLLADRCDQEAHHVRDGGDWPLLLFRINFLEFEFS